MTGTKLGIFEGRVLVDKILQRIWLGIIHVFYFIRKFF